MAEQRIENSIFITDDKVNIDLHDIYEKDYIKIEWEGQTNSSSLDHFGIGTHIFYRRIKSNFFIYLGKVYKEKIKRERTDDRPIKKKFYIKADSIIFCPFTTKDEEIDGELSYNNSGKFIRAAMRKLKLPVTQM